ncbi:MAG: Clp1/GlmU family protein, partial [Candidatus Bathyarchaeia archaeon]
MQLLKLNVDAGKSLIVSGPALIKLIKGECEVLGAPLNFNILIKKYRQLPVTALQDSELEVNLGEGGLINKVNENVIPDSWQNLMQTILKEEKIMVIGGVDSGKNAFCTLVINKFLKAKGKVAIIDVDVGQ